MRVPVPTEKHKHHYMLKRLSYDHMSVIQINASLTLEKSVLPMVLLQIIHHNTTKPTHFKLFKWHFIIQLSDLIAKPCTTPKQFIQCLSFVGGHIQPYTAIFEWLDLPMSFNPTCINCPVMFKIKESIEWREWLGFVKFFIWLWYKVHMPNCQCYTTSVNEKSKHPLLLWLTLLLSPALC